MGGLFRRGLRRVLLVSGVVGVLVLPAAPAGAAPDARYAKRVQRVQAMGVDGFWSLQSAATTFKKDGVKYRLRLSASESVVGGIVSGTSYTASVSRTRDPKGVTRSTQSHTWFFSSQRDGFTANGKLTSASANSGTDLAPYGKVAVKFTGTSALDKACNGGVKSRKGDLTGSLVLKTGTGSLGTIKALPSRATLTFISRDADCGGGGGPLPCPSNSKAAYGDRYSKAPLSVWASRRAGSDAASVSASSWEELTLEKTTVFGSLSRSVFAVVAAKKVVVADNLSTATIGGAMGTWLSGTANFAAMQKATATNWSPCGKDKVKEHRIITRNGTMTGSFAVDFFAGPDRKVGKGMDSAYASRTVVRKR